ncbi:RteC domain-containing protein [Bacteroidales bacterium OttesenSCG-928-I14]|nr:RteC domain-containing protein [Bacteroidales bacterium OttesenSCG-928-I14]
MKDKIEKIVSELSASIQVGELELYDIVQNTPSMILTMENTFEELKATVSEYEFPTRQEEITFFKETKPKAFSKLIYLRKIYYLEVNRPVSNYTTIRTYLEKEHNQINDFCNKNTEFIQYYRSGQSCFDRSDSIE